MKKLTAGQVKAKVRHLAKQIRTQEQLDALLMSETDPFDRRSMYEYMKPFLTFDSRFPTSILQGEPDIQRPKLTLPSL